MKHSHIRYYEGKEALSYIEQAVGMLMKKLQIKKDSLASSYNEAVNAWGSSILTEIQQLKESFLGKKPTTNACQAKSVITQKANSYTHAFLAEMGLFKHRGYRRLNSAPILNLSPMSPEGSRSETCSP